LEPICAVQRIRVVATKPPDLIRDAPCCAFSTLPPLLSVFNLAPRNTPRAKLNTGELREIRDRVTEATLPYRNHKSDSVAALPAYKTVPAAILAPRESSRIRAAV
jgi:hypothetical protein